VNTGQLKKHVFSALKVKGAKQLAQSLELFGEKHVKQELWQIWHKDGVFG
jgi:hypothetical protein